MGSRRKQPPDQHGLPLNANTSNELNPNLIKVLEQLSKK